MNKRTIKKPDIGFYILIFIILIATVYLLSNGSGGYANIEYSEVRRQFEQENVEYFALEDDTLYLTLREPIDEDGKITNVSHQLLNYSIF